MRIGPLDSNCDMCNLSPVYFMQISGFSCFSFSLNYSNYCQLDVDSKSEQHTMSVALNYLECLTNVEESWLPGGWKPVRSVLHTNRPAPTSLPAQDDHNHRWNVRIFKRFYWRFWRFYDFFLLKIFLLKILLNFDKKWEHRLLQKVLKKF